VSKTKKILALMEILFGLERQVINNESGAFGMVMNSVRITGQWCKSE
jgi:hypothetical protein